MTGRLKKVCYLEVYCIYFLCMFDHHVLLLVTVIISNGVINPPKTLFVRSGSFWKSDTNLILRYNQSSRVEMHSAPKVKSFTNAETNYKLLDRWSVLITDDIIIIIIIIIILPLNAIVCNVGHDLNLLPLLPFSYIANIIHVQFLRAIFFALQDEK